jgi:hypothetical protein
MTRLWIPGDRIFQSGVSGPYYVHVSVIEGNESMNSSLIICETDYYAGIFNYTDFTHTHFDASISDYGLDSNSDWLYESLRVEVPVTVEWGNYYSLWAYLVYPSNGTKVLSIDYRYLNTGPGILQASFSADLFSTHRLDGPYNIELNIHDYTWNLNINMSYATHAYNWTDFALPAPVPTPIELTPLHFDFPVDSNADSKYESLTVDVGVNVTEPGWYQTLAQLYSNGTRWTSNAWAANYSLQDFGFNYTRLSFTSPDIVSSLLSGTFYVAVAIHAYDDYSHRYSTADYTLGNYQISDFVAMQPHLETNYSDYGLDSDEDGLFNFLILEIGVHAPVEEEVIFRAWVNGVSTNSTGPVMTVTTVPAGHSTVDLVLNGELFADAQVNGPYEIYVFMTYASESFIMDHTYTTGYYEWTQFSNPGATFGDPHRDNGLDVNGDRAFEYLAIYANVSVQAPGYYNVTLAFWSPPLPGILWNRTYLDKGQNYVGFLIPGDWVKAVRYNGSFWLELDLYDAVGVHLWDSKHITSYYRWMDFAKPPIASFVVEVPPAGNMSYTFDASLSSVDAVFYEVRWDFDADGEWDTGWS